MFNIKVSAINRIEEDHTKSRSSDLRKVQRNYDPQIRPMENAREYVRAMNAAKLDRVFAKPFIGALSHQDAVQCMDRNPKHLNSLVTGSGDGQVRVWDLAARRCLRRLQGHQAQVTGVCYQSTGDHVLSCSVDNTVKLWSIPMAPFIGGDIQQDIQTPNQSYISQGQLRGIDHHISLPHFVTCGHQVELWHYDRKEPITKFSWGSSETVTSIKFNPVEQNIFSTTASDRSLMLYDTRTSTPIRKLIMQTKSNKICFNPIEAFNFVAANDDTNLYSFDMRNFKTSTGIHQDFTSAVMDVDFSPTGRAFVAGSYDRTVRIFPYNAGHSVEVYHTKRMQRVLCVKYSGDSTYVFSGSDDMNLRIWKSKASEQLGPLVPREKSKRSYQSALVNRYKHLPEVKRILRHRHLPKQIYKTAEQHRVQKSSERTKLQNKIKNSKADTILVKAARKKKLVQEIE